MMPRNFLRPLFLSVAAALAAAPLAAHEFWIAPQAYRVESGDRLAADLYNGTGFEGVRYAYFPDRFVDFSLNAAGMSFPVVARLGSMPALEIRAPRSGLLVVSYQSRASSLAYDDWATFVDFVNEKGLGDAAALQDARGLAQADVTERFTRYSKSLIAVDAGEGADARFGHLTEFVALANPYTDDLSDGLPVQLFYAEASRADVQVDLFARAFGSDEVMITHHRTDANGVVVLPVTPGTEYMIDSVVLREAPAGSDAMWESLWANMTFAVLP